MPFTVPASFWRGGTSRGLLFRARDLVQYPQSVRERIILTALGSPDPDGRQIDGLGGGVSSLSKCAIVSSPGEGAETLLRIADPAYAWPDPKDLPDPDGSSARGPEGWDIVYRFVQVGVSTPTLDWRSTCGNMLAAAASLACSGSPLGDGLVPYSARWAASRGSRFGAIERGGVGEGGGAGGPREPAYLPLRVLAAGTGDVLKARVPLDPLTGSLFEPRAPEEGVKIAGVPGVGAPVELEFPLRRTGRWPAGGPRSVLEVDWKGSKAVVDATIASAGLVNIFLPASELPAAGGWSSTEALFAAHPAELDADRELHAFCEKVREAGSSVAGIPYVVGSAEPKVCIVAPSGDGKPDVIARAISVGNFHRTIPGTTLSALAVASTDPSSIFGRPPFTPHRLVPGETVTVTAHHPAGLAEATLRLNSQGDPESVVVMRTAREVMSGHVCIPGIAA